MDCYWGGGVPNVEASSPAIFSWLQYIHPKPIVAKEFLITWAQREGFLLSAV